MIKENNNKILKQRRRITGRKGSIFSIMLLIIFLLALSYLTYHILTGYFYPVKGTESTGEKRPIGEVASAISTTYASADAHKIEIRLAAQKATYDAYKLIELTGLNPFSNINPDFINALSEKGIIHGDEEYLNTGSLLKIPYWNKITDGNPETKIITPPINDLFKKTLFYTLSRELSTLGKPSTFTITLNNDEKNNDRLIITGRDDYWKLPITNNQELLLTSTSEYSLTEGTADEGRGYQTGDTDTPLANKGFYNSPNKRSTNNRKIEYIVVHYTASNNEKSDLATLTSPTTQVSAHYLIGKKGEIYQLVREKDIAWHAGCSDEKNKQIKGAFCNPRYENINTRSIGIEITNKGWDCNPETDYCEEAKQICYDDLKTKDYPNPCSQFKTRKWQVYTEPQVESLIKLLADICERNHLDPEKAIIGHEEVNPIRKQDPGPMLDLRKIRKLVSEEISKNTHYQSSGQSSPEYPEHPEQNQGESQEPSSKNTITGGAISIDGTGSQYLQKPGINNNCELKRGTINDDKGTAVTTTLKNLNQIDADLIEYIIKLSKEMNIRPETALSLITQESRGINQPRNAAGAFGITQLTPIAIKEIRRIAGDDPRFKCSPEDDVKCQALYGIKYLSTRSTKERTYGGLTVYCTKNKNCFSTKERCELKTKQNCYPETIQKRTYSGTDAQLRYYNGWSYFGYPDFDYVENVKRYEPYWKYLLCTRGESTEEKLAATTGSDEKIFGSYFFNPSFTITTKNKLKYYEQTTSFAQEIMSAVQKSNKPEQIRKIISDEEEQSSKRSPGLIIRNGEECLNRITGDEEATNIINQLITIKNFYDYNAIKKKTIETTETKGVEEENQKNQENQNDEQRTEEETPENNNDNNNNQEICTTIIKNKRLVGEDEKKNDKENKESIIKKVLSDENSELFINKTGVGIRVDEKAMNDQVRKIFERTTPDQFQKDKEDRVTIAFLRFDNNNGPEETTFPAIKMIDGSKLVMIKNNNKIITAYLTINDKTDDNQETTNESNKTPSCDEQYKYRSTLFCTEGVINTAFWLRIK